MNNIRVKNGMSYADCERICRAAQDVKRGDIWIADLRSDSFGSEQGGVRPVIVIQNNTGNHFSPTITIIPITSAMKKDMPTHVRLSKNTGGLMKDSTAMVEQIRTVDKKRIMKYVGTLSDTVMSDVGQKLMIQLGI